MTDSEWNDFKKAKLAELSPVNRDRAVGVLREMLAPYPDVLADLSARIAEDPVNWLHGRKDAECFMCDGSGVYGNMAEDVCKVCKGTKRHPEMGLHHGWGMAVRNYLRDHGCNEAQMGVDNLDDYYSQLVELAVAPVAA